MSHLQLDKKVIQDGRKEPLKDAAVPLREQIPEKLLEKCNDLFLGRKVVEIWRRGNADRTQWLERQRIYLESWDEFLTASSDGPFEGSSNLHLPMPFIVAKTYHARMMQALLNSDPPFSIKPRTAQAVERIKLIEGLMSYAINDWANKNKGVYSTLDRWLWDWIVTGMGIIKQRWETDYSSYIDVQTTMEPNGQTYIEGQPLQPKFKSVEKEVKVTKKCFDGPVWENVFHEDIVILGPEMDPDLSDAVIERQFVTASQLWTLADKKIFNSDVVEKVIQSGPDRELGAIGTDIKMQRAINQGITAKETDADLDRYEILEAYMKADVDGSGINSEIILWVHSKTKEIFRATYLYRVNKRGKRPYRKIDFHKRPGQPYSMGLIEVMYPLTVELDAIHNMRIDWGILSTMPYGFYKAASSIEPTTLQLKPGALVPLDDPQRDIYFPQMGNRTIFGMQEEASLQNMIERLTGISELSMGVVSSTQGAARTATGVNSLIAEANANLDVHLRRLAQGWKEALLFLFYDLRSKAPAGLSFRVTGEDGKDYWGYIKQAEDLGDYDDYDFEITASTANSNPAVKLQLATQLLQLTANPLDIQLGIITPSNRYEALKNFLQASGIKDVSRFIQKPSNYQLSLTPEEEANRILSGVQTPVNAQGDHDGFLQYFDFLTKNDEFLGRFSKEQIQALAIQAKQHAQAKQAMESAASQQANMQQMSMNMQMSPSNQITPMAAQPTVPMPAAGG